MLRHTTALVVLYLHETQHTDPEHATDCLLRSVFKTHVHQTRHGLSTYSRHVKIAAVLFWHILRISVGDKDGVELDFNPGGVGRSLTCKERKKNTFKTLRKRVGEV